MHHLLIFTIILVIFAFFIFSRLESFSYAKNPCKAFTNCAKCADAPGCGWCPDLGQCQPMAQDGFPIRTKDLTTGALDVSPYLADGVIPVITKCPTGCKSTDLGDCDCSSIKYTNTVSCAPECYATYEEGCVCPNGDPSVGSNIDSDGDKAIIQKLSNVKDEINKLLSSTRIHVCSPHTFVINSTRC